MQNPSWNPRRHIEKIKSPRWHTLITVLDWPLDLLTNIAFNLGDEGKTKSYLQYAHKWQTSMKKAYAKALDLTERNGRRRIRIYDKKVSSLVLKLGTWFWFKPYTKVRLWETGKLKSFCDVEVLIAERRKGQDGQCTRRYYRMVDKKPVNAREYATSLWLQHNNEKTRNYNAKTRNYASDSYKVWQDREVKIYQNRRRISYQLHFEFICSQQAT